MENYTVKQIAEMLNTNPETVRRWIRDHKLQSKQSSRKDGNVVSEDSLTDFIKTSPKYAGSLVTLISSSIACKDAVTAVGATGSAVAATALLSGLAPIGIGIAALGIVAGVKVGEKDSNVDVDETRALIMRSISENELVISKKEKMIVQRESEIEELKKRNQSLQQFLAVLDQDSLKKEDK